MPPAKRKASANRTSARLSTEKGKMNPAERKASASRSSARLSTEKGQMNPAERKASVSRSSARLSTEKGKMNPAERKPSASRSSARLSSEKGKITPAKRKAPASRSSDHLSTKKGKTTTTKSEAELEMQQEAATTTARRVQLPNACKEKLEELRRYLKFQSVGSTVDFLLPTPEGAKAILEFTKDLGYNSGAETIDWLVEMVRTKQSPDFENTSRQVEWLLPTETRRLQELTRELGFDRGGQTVDWLLRMASEEFLTLTRLLRFQDSANTVQWLLHQAGRVGIQDTQAHIHHPASLDNVIGYPGTYSSHAAPPFPTPVQFSQNPQGVTPTTFTPRGGLGGSSTTRYSSSPYNPTPTPTLVQSRTGPVTAHRSDLPIPNTYFNGFQGSTDGQSQMQRDGFQRGRMPSNSMYNSQSFPHPLQLHGRGQA